MPSRSRTTRRLFLAVAALAVALTIVGSVAVLALKPQPAICNGIDRQLGGCDTDQPVFNGSTCEAVGIEFGDQLDQRIVKILGGPDVVNGERKSVRISAAEFLLTGRANQHLREIGIIAECGADHFLAAAERRFSDTLRAEVGDYLSEFEHHSYADWRADLRKTLRAIDMDENVSNPSA